MVKTHEMRWLDPDLHTPGVDEKVFVATDWGIETTVYEDGELRDIDGDEVYAWAHMRSFSVCFSNRSPWADMEVDMTNPIDDNAPYELKNCARCGGDHDGLVPEPLEHTIETSETIYTHWAPCPENEQPILWAHIEEE